MEPEAEYNAGHFTPDWINAMLLKSVECPEVAVLWRVESYTQKGQLRPAWRCLNHGIESHVSILAIILRWVFIVVVIVLVNEPTLGRHTHLTI